MLQKQIDEMKAVMTPIANLEKKATEQPSKNISSLPNTSSSEVTVYTNAVKEIDQNNTLK